MENSNPCILATAAHPLHLEELKLSAKHETKHTIELNFSWAPHSQLVYPVGKDISPTLAWISSVTRNAALCATRWDAHTRWLVYASRNVSISCSLPRRELSYHQPQLALSTSHRKQASLKPKQGFAQLPHMNSSSNRSQNTWILSNFGQSKIIPNFNLQFRKTQYVRVSSSGVKSTWKAIESANIVAESLY